jgi:hypothetical protein
MKTIVTLILLIAGMAYLSSCNEQRTLVKKLQKDSAERLY